MKLKVLVGEVMRKDVMKVSMDDSIKKAAQIMKNKKIGSVVVFGEKNVKGIVTTSDIVYKYVAESRGEKVSNIMTTELVTISPHKTVEEASKLMVEKSIEKLLVMDKDRLLGIITSNDILRIEPALFEILLERMKIGASLNAEAAEFVECEVCGNYSDDVEETDGVYKCEECRE